MLYTTEGRIRAMLGHPSERDVSSELVQQYAEKSEAWIEGMLGHMYTTPFATYPLTSKLITSWVEDMAAFKILKHPGYRQKSGVDTAMIAEQFQIAVAQVRDAARRKMRVPGLVARDTTKSTTEDYNKFFGLDDPEHWRIDPGILRDQAARRSKS